MARAIDAGGNRITLRCSVHSRSSRGVDLGVANRCRLHSKFQPNESGLFAAHSVKLAKVATACNLNTVSSDTPISRSSEMQWFGSYPTTI